MTDETAAVCDFLVRLAADVDGAGPRPLSFYLSRFPDHEAAVAREYLAHLCLVSGPDPLEPDPPAGRSAEGPPAERYRVLEEIARGGMGTVFRVRDDQLDRDLAMKVHHRFDERSGRRFLREARVTGRLDHPGVVPVHDVGVAADGRPCFTMRLIHGVTLREAFDRYHAGSSDWTLSRALDVMAKVCDALAYAHSVGVVHRDLKPSNVMVGGFGEVYVVDWGLARVELDPIEETAAESAVTSSLLTMDGDVIGTPSYMAPEQAEGRLADLGPTADVYSVGAILYHLLAGGPPYAVAGEETPSREILRRVRTGGLVPLREARRRCPPELISICEKAMQRDRRRRYPDMREMAADVRAFLEQRVVTAHEVGSAARLRKWVARNRALAATLLLALAGGLVAIGVVVDQARARSRMLRLLADAVTPESIERNFELLWPVDERSVPEIAALLGEARKIVARRDDYARELDVLRARALPIDIAAPLETKFRRDEEERMFELSALAVRFEESLRAGAAGTAPLPDRATPELMTAQLEEIRAQVAKGPRTDVPHLTFHFREPVDQVLFEALSRLPQTLDRLTGIDPVVGFVPIAERSIALARDAVSRTPVDLDECWREAVAEIGDVRRSPMYGGLALTPQDGLVPLGRDPVSELWEFGHLFSGALPRRDSHGRLCLDEDSCIVLVLVPADAARLGSQRHDGTGLGYRIDPWAESDAIVVAAFPMRAYLIGKYEVTQAQWERLTTRNPSRRVATPTRPEQEADPSVTGKHPVESVSATQAERTLRRVGLRLPTEMQWEHAYRAGTETVWPTGDDPLNVIGFGNVADESSGDIVAVHARMAYAAGLDDGYPRSAAVDAFVSNRFGLVGMAGNVGEWCRDRGPTSYERVPLDFRNGERLGEGDGTRPVRGGSFLRNVLGARSAARLHLGAELRDLDIGVRAARELHP